MIFLPAHLFLFYALMKLKFDWQSVLWIFLFWTLLSGYGIGVGFHRLLSHKAFKTYGWIEAVVSYLGCMAIQGSPIFWANIHRGYHHPYADTKKDIHSPIHGRLKSYILWTITVDYKAVKFDFVQDLLRKKVQRALHFGYFFVVWGSWALVFLINEQIFMALVIAQIMTLHQELCVNLFCHIQKGGYRNFDIPDRSVNRYFFGLLFWGVGYHNNHHARPNHYNFAYSKFEFDPTTLLVATVKKRNS